MSCKSSFYIQNNHINLDVNFKTKTVLLYVKSDYGTHGEVNTHWRTSEDFDEVISFAREWLQGFSNSKIEPVIKDIELYLNTSETFS